MIKNGHQSDVNIALSEFFSVEKPCVVHKRHGEMVLYEYDECKIPWNVSRLSTEYHFLQQFNDHVEFFVGSFLFWLLKLCDQRTKEYWT